MAKPPGNDGTGAKSHLAMVEAAMMVSTRHSYRKVSLTNRQQLSGGAWQPTRQFSSRRRSRKPRPICPNCRSQAEAQERSYCALASRYVMMLSHDYLPRVVEWMLTLHLVQFDDEDARGVEGLDNLGDGLLHRMKSLTTGQSFGVRYDEPSLDMVLIGAKVNTL